MKNKKETHTELEKSVAGCSDCSLHKNRNKSVFAKGNQNASIMLVGEAPGKDENSIGLPFVGTSGKRLDHLLEEADFNIEDIYFCNVVKCRPIKNNKDRKPNIEEINACKKYLFSQIEIIQPEAIILCGTTAVKVFGIKESIRNCFKNSIDYYKYDNKTLFAIYHPRASIKDVTKLKQLKKIRKYLKENLNV